MYVRRYNEVSDSRAYCLWWLKTKKKFSALVCRMKKSYKIFTLKWKFKSTSRKTSICQKLVIDKNCWRPRKFYGYNALYSKKIFCKSFALTSNFLRIKVGLSPFKKNLFYLLQWKQDYCLFLKNAFLSS